MIEHTDPVPYPGPPYQSRPPMAWMPLAIVLFMIGIGGIHWASSAHRAGSEPWLFVLFLLAMSGGVLAMAIRLVVRAYGRRTAPALGLLAITAFYLLTVGGLLLLTASRWVIGGVEVLAGAGLATIALRWARAGPDDDLSSSDPGFTPSHLDR